MAETKRLDVLVCYDLKRGITDEEEETLLLAHPDLVTVPIISMADFSKKDTIGCYGTTEKEDNTKTVYPPHFYQHEVGNVIIDDTLARIKVQKMKIAGWTLPKEEQVRLLNLGTDDAPQCIKVNSTLPIPIATQANALFTEYKDVFTWNYKDLRGILEQIAQHKIELDIGIPPAHQSRYRMNPNYASIVKHDIDKLLAAGFVEPVDNPTWLSPIVVVPKKNGKLRICVDFRKLNAATKKDPYPIPFTDSILDTVAVHEMYSFLNGYSGYHQIKIAPEDRFKTAFVTDWGAFVWVVMPFGLKNAPAIYQKAVNLAFTTTKSWFLRHPKSGPRRQCPKRQRTTRTRPLGHRFYTGFLDIF